MPEIDPPPTGKNKDNRGKPSVVLPFAKPESRPITQPITQTTLAALLAVTVVHDSGISPEQRLIELIEESGDALVLDAADTPDNLPDDLDMGAIETAANDNNPTP